MNLYVVVVVNCGLQVVAFSRRHFRTMDGPESPTSIVKFIGSATVCFEATAKAIGDRCSNFVIACWEPW